MRGKIGLQFGQITWSHAATPFSIAKSYPGLPTPYVAEKIVKGVLLNERMVYVPKIFALSVWLLR